MVWVKACWDIRGMFFCHFVLLELLWETFPEGLQCIEQDFFEQELGLRHESYAKIV